MREHGRRQERENRTADANTGQGVPGHSCRCKTDRACLQSPVRVLLLSRESRPCFAPGEQYRMPDKVLGAFIAKYIASQPTPVVEFVWQGGEPTLLGIDFFRRVVELQKPFTKDKTIANSLQTNGTLLTDEWCRFLKRHDFMVGISLDGPKEVHDRYRRDRKGSGTFDRAMRGLRLLQQHKVDYNVLACVGRETAVRPLDVYRFLREAGVEFIQFTPVVERRAVSEAENHGLGLAAPAALDRLGEQGQVTPWTVEPGGLRRFPDCRLRGVGSTRCGEGLCHELRVGPQRLDRKSLARLRPRESVRTLACHRAQRRCLRLRPLRLPRIPARQHPFG